MIIFLEMLQKHPETSEVIGDVQCLQPGPFLKRTAWLRHMFNVPQGSRAQDFAVGLVWLLHFHGRFQWDANSAIIVELSAVNYSKQCPSGTSSTVQFKLIGGQTRARVWTWLLPAERRGRGKKDKET